MAKVNINILSSKRGGLGKGLEHVAQLVSDATGATARGKRLNAEADRDVKLIKAQTSRDIATIEEGLAEYRQGNLIAIAEKATPLLEDLPDPKIEDPDWIALWLEKAQNTSDEDLQQWWARILAGEAQSQGSFSKWALNAVACMSKDDIEAFAKLAQCVWAFGPSLLHREVVYWESSRKIVPLAEYVLQRTGLSTGFGSPLLGYMDVQHRQAYIQYFDEKYAMRFPESLEVPRGSTISLTLLGKELLPLCDAKPNDEYKKDCIAQWRSRDVIPIVAV